MNIARQELASFRMFYKYLRKYVHSYPEWNFEPLQIQVCTSQLLGDFASQHLIAMEAVPVGICYCAQTPNRWFPIDPHLFTPLIHFLPQSWQRRLLRNFTTWGLVTRPTKEQCDELLREVRLLDYREFTRLFPNAEIYRERFFGLTKSFVAIGSGDHSLSVQQETTRERNQLQGPPRFAGQATAAARPKSLEHG
jgi:hypothetical protein